MDATRTGLRANPPMGVLVVGMGFLGAQRAAACRVARGLQLAAVTDLDGALAVRQARRWGVAAVESLKRGLDRSDVASVIVATPHADHDDAVRMALDAGKHVLCEKPLAIDPSSARDLARLAYERGLRLATGFNHRFYAPVRDALDLVARGAIGRVEAVRATIGHRASAEFLAGWHVDRAVSGGGTLMDNGPHACDLARQFLGEMISVRGETRDDLGLPFGIESEAFARFVAHDGGTAEIRSSWTLASGYLTIEVRGTRGNLHAETAPWRLSGRLADGTAVSRSYLADRLLEKVHRRRFGCERSLVREMEDFADPRPECRNASGWDGAMACGMVDSAYLAAASGSEVALSPPKEATREVAAR